MCAFAHGSVIATSDENGDVRNQYAYSPYGVNNDDSGIPFRYTGQKLDIQSGLYYYKARWYDPEVGRFLQPDPIGYSDGMNLYAYVGGDPVNSTDPTGLTVDCFTCQFADGSTGGTRRAARLGAGSSGGGFGSGGSGGSGGGGLSADYTPSEVVDSGCGPAGCFTRNRRGSLRIGSTQVGLFAATAPGGNSSVGGGGSGSRNGGDDGDGCLSPFTVSVGNIVRATGEAISFAGGYIVTIGGGIAFAGAAIPAEPFVESAGGLVIGVGFGAIGVGEGIGLAGTATQGFGQGGIAGTSGAVETLATDIAQGRALGRLGPLGRVLEGGLDGVNVFSFLTSPNLSDPVSCD